MLTLIFPHTFNMIVDLEVIHQKITLKRIILGLKYGLIKGKG